MTDRLIPRFIDRLGKILELCSSPVDGEALAAARTATSIVCNPGPRWTTLLAPLAPEAPPTPPPPATPPRTRPIYETHWVW